MKYLSVEVTDPDGPLTLEVGGGLGGRSWATYKVRPGSRSLHRLTSPLCPVRDYPEDAEVDLAIYCVMRLNRGEVVRQLVDRYRSESTRLRYLLKSYTGKVPE